MSFARELSERGLGPLLRDPARTLQVNVGKRCDLACHHCHVEAGPKRTEAIDRARGGARARAARGETRESRTLDLTGGAPELNRALPRARARARALGRARDRPLQPDRAVRARPGGHGRVPRRATGVEVVASLPCYTARNVDAQRGSACSSAASRRCAAERARLRPSRVAASRSTSSTTRSAPSLPPAQAELEAQLRRELRERFGIEFDRLLTITNMPIKRFARALEREGRHAEYMACS